VDAAARVKASPHHLENSREGGDGEGPDQRGRRSAERDSNDGGQDRARRQGLAEEPRQQVNDRPDAECDPENLERGKPKQHHAGDEGWQQAQRQRGIGRQRIGPEGDPVELRGHLRQGPPAVVSGHGAILLNPHPP